MNRTTLVGFLLFFPVLGMAHGGTSHPGTILTESQKLRALGIPVLYEDASSGLGITYATPEITNRISAASHLGGACAGFERLADNSNPIEVLKSSSQILSRQMSLDLLPLQPRALASIPAIENAIREVSAENLRSTVEWLSSFPTRFNKDSQPNRHVEQLVSRLQSMTQGSPLKIEIKTISHQSTPQKSILLRILGSERPQEILVLGAHLDSINQSWSGSKLAPGADDNASGSANLIEALRVLLKQEKAPARTLDFFWYAGEESGLLGSAEIAEDYKNRKEDVVGVLQLDMTLYPGEGEFVIGNVQDYTNAWLRDYFVAMNDTYLKARLVPDQCGYGCSDHASWHRRGFPTLLPFEATTKTMNRAIHTTQDVIGSSSSFRHSAVFSQIALIFAMDLGNSDQRPPRM